MSPPANPTPANLAVLESPPAELRWEPSRHADSYDVFLWEEGGENPAGPIVFNIEEPQLTLNRELKPGRKYFWRVEASSPMQSVKGKIWAFGIAARRAAKAEKK